MTNAEKIGMSPEQSKNIDEYFEFIREPMQEREIEL
ncbi:hypothetical protein O1Q80_00353 [Lonepinella sp. MS14435]